MGKSPILAVGFQLEAELTSGIILKAMQENAQIVATF